MLNNRISEVKGYINMTKRLHIAPESGIQMETTIYSEPSQSNLDEYPRVTDGLVINYTPQMNITNSFTKALLELQYDQLLPCVSTDSRKPKRPKRKDTHFFWPCFRVQQKSLSDIHRVQHKPFSSRRHLLPT